MTTFKMIFFSTSIIKIFSNVYIFVLILGNTISIYLKKYNVVNILGIQPSLKTNTEQKEQKNGGELRYSRWVRITLYTKTTSVKCVIYCGDYVNEKKKSNKILTLR